MPPKNGHNSGKCGPNKNKIPSLKPPQVPKINKHPTHNHNKNPLISKKILKILKNLMTVYNKNSIFLKSINKNCKPITSNPTLKNNNLSHNHLYPPNPPNQKPNPKTLPTKTPIKVNNPTTVFSITTGSSITTN
jgi:hypothetical protein